MIYLIITIVILSVWILYLFFKLSGLQWKVGYYEYFIKKYKDRFDKEQWEFIEDVLNKEHFGKKYFQKKFPAA